MGRRHISTSGLAASALWTMVFAVFRPVRPPFACDASSIGPGTKLCSRYTTSGLVKPEVRFLAAISAPKTVPALRQRGPGPWPRALSDANACAARVRSRRVWRTLQQNHNESVFFTCSPPAAAKGEKIKLRFSRKPLDRFFQKFTRTCPQYRPTERCYNRPAPRIRGGARGPQIWR